MTSDAAARRRRIEALLRAAAALPAGERSEFLAHRLGEDLELETTVDEEVDARARAGATEVPSALGRGSAVQRYLIVERLGSGGMGEVYRAYDPELDRSLAIKVLRADRGASDESGRRLQREAQAMARLSHPNVVAVYDVGTFQHGVFIAMELLDGVDLDTWLAAERRGWREVVAVFRQAGRGLEAAHAAGLLHRDFKPANVVVCGNGAAKVLDFGLARPHGTVEPARVDLTAARDLAERWLETPITAPGALLGTPGYLAPEQLAGGVSDARSDQFSFCVALWRSLFGRHPFEADGLPALLAAIRAGRLVEPPPGSDVPAWLRRVVQRGLAADPGARYPAMADLIEALEQDPARAARRWVQRAGLAALVLLAAAGAWRLAAERRNLCAGGERRVARVWGDAARAHLRDALTAGGGAWRESTWWRVEALLDRYATDWAAAHRDACEATHLRGEQSAELLDLRMFCLDSRLAEFEALVALYAGDDPELLSRAVEATEGLSSLVACADARALRRHAPLPSGAGLAGVEALQARHGAIRARDLAGDYPGALAAAEALAPEARRAGYEPLTAEVLLELGSLQRRERKPGEAGATLREALWSAEAGGSDTTAVRASIELARFESLQLAHLERGAEWLAHGRAVFSRLRDEPELRASLWRTEAELALQEGRFDAALEVARRTLEAEQERLGRDDRRLAATLDTYSRALHQNARYDEALAAQRRLVAIDEATLGPGHPIVAYSLIDLGQSLERTGAYGDAEATYLRALAIVEKSLGLDDPAATYAHQALGALYEMSGRFEDSLRHNRIVLERAVASGNAYDRAVAHNNLGVSLVRLRRFEEAIEHHREALAGFEAHFGRDHPIVGHPLWGLGVDLVGLGRFDEAVAVLERGAALREATDKDPAELAEMRFALARALWGQGRDRERALAVARAARDGFPPGRATERDEVAAWIEARRGAG